MEYIRAIDCDIYYQLIDNDNIRYQIIQLSKSVNQNNKGINIILFGKNIDDSTITKSFYFKSSDYIKIIHPFKTYR